jgi:hypothetical protein
LEPLVEPLVSAKYNQGAPSSTAKIRCSWWTPKAERREERMLHIRNTLKKYRKALIFGSTLALTPSPSETVLHTFRDQYHNRSSILNDPYATLSGSKPGQLDAVCAQATGFHGSSM